MPKNLKGGYQVIDLRNIDLTLTAEAQNITDVEVLEQLATLRDYIEPSHNYAKPLKKKLKPILVSIRDKKSDEEQESSIWGNLSVYDDELSYKIEAVVDNSPLKVLQINVVFELVTEEDGSTHYEIDTATVLLSELVKMGDINVEGITSKGIANTGGLANIGDVAISGDLSATGDATVGGDLDVTGDVKVFENIVDKDGHKRFIEGNINLFSEITGFTKTYGRWALSGTHLMIVLGLTIASGTTLTAQTYAEVFVPQWVKDKIIPLHSGSIETKSFQSIGSGSDEGHTYSGSLRKIDNAILIYGRNTNTTEREEHIRIEFDLLIDNEEQE